MAATELLTSTIEVGIGIAGFASIVAAIGSGQWSPTAKVRFPWLLSQSATIILFSALPMLLMEGGLPLESAWVVSSAIFSVYLLIIIPYRIYKLRAVAERPAATADRPSIIYSFLGFSPLLLLVGNLVIWQAGWPYITTLMLFVILSFLNFYSLLHEFWED